MQADYTFDQGTTKLVVITFRQDGAAVPLPAGLTASAALGAIGEPKTNDIAIVPDLSEASSGKIKMFLTSDTTRKMSPAKLYQLDCLATWTDGYQVRECPFKKTLAVKETRTQ